MAEFTISGRERNNIGNKVEEFGQFTTGGAETDGVVVTTLYRLDHIEISSPGTGTDATYTVYKNSTTASTLEDDSGRAFVGSLTAANTYQYRAIGW